MNYKLEYKEKTGQFHLNYNKTHPENTNGWVTIFTEINDNDANLFFELIEYGFPFKLKKHKVHYVRFKAEIFKRIKNSK